MKRKFVTTMVAFFAVINVVFSQKKEKAPSLVLQKKSNKKQNPFPIFQGSAYKIARPLADSDGDGIDDATDLDDDNDGILDVDELVAPVSRVLNYEYYKPVGLTYSFEDEAFRQNVVKWMNNNTPTEKGTVNSFDIANNILSGKAKNFLAVKYTGYIYIEKAGVYTFKLDDVNESARLLINGTVVVTTDTTGSVPKTITRTVTLQAGYFPFEFLYYEEGRTATQTYFNIKYSSTQHGIAERLLPFSLLTNVQPNADIDGDGIPNRLDLDSDNDGIPDVIESGNPNVIDANNDGRVDGRVDANGVPISAKAGGTVPNAIDTDGDGVRDIFDLDSDNDGIYDVVESGNNFPNASGKVTGTRDANGVMDNAKSSGNLVKPKNYDGDTKYNYIDLDSDNDGISDLAESGTTLQDANNDGKIDGFTDANKDGVHDGAGMISTPVNTDNDSNPALPNYTDLDSDNDGINDIDEAVGISDFDGNGLKDSDTTLVSNGVGTAYTTVNGAVVTGTDADNDGILGIADRKPTVYGDVRDNDGDGVPDNIDKDDDNDGVLDAQECLQENTVFNENRPQPNGVGDITHSHSNTSKVEIDFALLDSSVRIFVNGVNIHSENKILEMSSGDFQSATDVLLTAPTSPTTNFTNYWQENSNFPRLKIIIDKDTGISMQGTTSRTDTRLYPVTLSSGSLRNVPLNTGNNTVRIENLTGAGGNAVKYTITFTTQCADSDGDGIPNNFDLDIDNDGITDLVESGNPKAIDANNDGIVDGSNAAGVGADGIPNSVQAGNADGGAVANPVDTDNDGIPNIADLDSDNDLIPDLVETGRSLPDTNTDGRVDGARDINGIPVNAKVVGVVLKPINTDSAGAYDYLDLDADNDGISDIEESGSSVKDTNNDGRVDTFTDANKDGMNDTGIMHTPVNSDNDTAPVLPNYRDLDSDNDGINDVDEAGIVDEDQNGLRDGNTLTSDVNNTYKTVNGTALTGADTDRDGIVGTADGLPNAYGDKQDADNDGISDKLDKDYDNDGILDTVEMYCQEKDPNSTSHYSVHSSAVRNKGQYKFFDWRNGTTGKQTLVNGMTSEFTHKGIKYIATISNVTGTGTLVSEPLETFATGSGTGNEWANAPSNVLHKHLADVTGVNEMFYNSRLQNNVNAGINKKFIVTIKAVKTSNNTPINYPIEVVVFDAEGTANSSESLVYKTSGSAFKEVEKFGTSNSGVSGEGTRTITYTATENNNTFPAYSTKGINVQIRTEVNSSSGRQGIAFAIRLYCDKDGDTLPNHSDLDSDNDGITDIVESGNTNAINADTNKDGRIEASYSVDKDGVADVAKDNNGTNPPAPIDTDGDTIPNFIDLDSDNDTISDLVESNSGATDSNSDARIDGAVGTDGIPNQVQVGNTDGGAVANPKDVDGDGVANYIDTDSDNDGISDIAESGSGATDTNNDGRIDTLVDTDKDGINDSMKAITLTNSDNDSGPVIPNYLDLDSDNDGINDVVEATGGVDSDNNGLKDNSATLISNPGTVYTTVNGTVKTGSDPDNDGIVGYEDGLPGTFGDALRYNLIISQVYQSATYKAIEVTNLESITVTTSIKLSIFNNNNGGDNVVSNASVSTSPLTIRPNQSVIFYHGDPNVTPKVNINSSHPTGGMPIPQSASLLSNLLGGDDTIIIGGSDSARPWKDRYDVVRAVDNTSSLVRADNVTKANDTYTSNEWVKFINDAIPVFGDTNPAPTVTRAKYVPLLSEVRNASGTNFNMGLGLHRVGSTSRTAGAWSNGEPDRSRTVIIQEDYQHTGSKLSARTLEVQGNNKLSVNNHLLVVSNNVNIHNNAQIRMLGNSQFIQTHEGNSNITGNGKLLIEQKSTLQTKYRYNYWSSPVAEQPNGANYRVGQIMKDGTTRISSNSPITNINFVTGYDGDGTTNPIKIADHWIYSYFNGANGARTSWVQKKQNGIIPVGQGYAMKSTGVNPQYFTFAGSPNDGDKTFTLSAKSTSLVGNPYPSAISADAFILQNKGTITGTLYFWEHKGGTIPGNVESHNKGSYEGGYGTRTFAMGTAANYKVDGTIGTGTSTFTAPSKYIAVGQGFFVSTPNANGGTLTFSNKLRDYNEPYFFKGESNKEELLSSKKELSILKLGLEYTNPNGVGIHRQLGISFKENNSYAFDYGYEGEMLDVRTTDMYWQFEEMNNEKLVIAGVDKLEEETKIPLTIVIGSDNPVYIKIDEIKDITRNVYLYDTVFKTSKRLDKENYFKLELPKGTYKDRFFVTFKEEKALNTDAVANAENNVTIYMNNKLNKLTITKRDDSIIKSIKAFNIIGQEIKNWKFDNSINNIELSTLGLPSSVYIIKVKTSKRTISKKVMVQ